MKGFFNIENKNLHYLCDQCKLSGGCHSPRMPVHGKGKKKILVIAEAPGASEDEQGMPLVGPAGQKVRKTLQACGVDLDRDCWKTNAVICRPPKNRTPTSKEIKCCRPNLEKVIKELQPEKIILLGKVAIQSYFLDRQSVTELGKWIGWKIPDQKYKAWIFPTYHPSYLLRQREKGNSIDAALENIFYTHLKEAVGAPSAFPDYSGIEKCVQVITNPRYLYEFLSQIRKSKKIALDYETTGLKPYATGHYIYSMAFSAGEELTGAFLYPKEEELQREIEKILRSTNIKKIGQNIKYEDIWTRQCLNYSIENWYWDTMLASHVLDNRKGITGLKFQTFVRYGIDDYSVDVSRFLRSDSSNGRNTIDKAPVEKILKYNGIDSITTWLLAHDQFKEIKEKGLANPLSLLHEGTLHLGTVETNGIHVDRDYYLQLDSHMERKIKRIKGQILSSEEAGIWKKKERKELDPNSHLQLSKLFFTHMNYKPTKFTAKENASIDQEAIEQIDSPFARNLLQYRKYSKLKDTYLKGFIIEDTGEGMIHPMFSLNTVSTYRSSSQAPNFQNIPVRDEEAQELIRSGIIPRSGRLLMEADYSGIEVRMSACNHHDKEMIRYIKDPSSDMHRDMAMELFLLEGEVPKHLRQGAKNGFVFPEFYGDYYINCARNLWGWMKKEDITALKSRGIKTFDQFESHVKEVERKFWNEKFKGYTRWKEKTWKEYQEKGYVQMLTGFRCTGYMRKNEVLNYPIQGIAFHCLLWSLIQVNNLLREEKMDTMVIGQIHDSIVMDVVPEEKGFIKKQLKEIMCERIREEWPWIIVPLDIEIQTTEKNGSWFKKQKEKI